MLEQKRGKEGVWDTDEREHNEGKGQGRGGEEGGSGERLVFQNTFHLFGSKTEGGVGNREIWQLTWGSTFFPCLLFPHPSLPKHPKTSLA